MNFAMILATGFVLTAAAITRVFMPNNPTASTPDPETAQATIDATAREGR